jgi:hypothetical protein
LTIQTSDPTGFALCQTAGQCFRANPTCNQGGDTGSCFCGTNIASCDSAVGTSGAANGPCVTAVTNAAGRQVVTLTTDAPTPATILTRYGDTAYAIGRLTSLASFAGAFCGTECQY